MVLFLGIDFGTSGVRAIALNETNQIVAESRLPYESESTARTSSGWNDILFALLTSLLPEVRSQVERIAINGTSATMLLCDDSGQPLSDALMYNDARARNVLPEVAKIAPPDSPACSATSTFTKAMWLHQRGELSSTDRIYIAHQADWIAQRLTRQKTVTDYHNALKLGYDVEAMAYPDWLLDSPVADWLPEVVEPGSAIASIHPEVSKTYGFPATCQVCAGTTDSIAAFLASGAQQSGEAVTSLGSTLVLKLLSPHPVSDQAFGIYSHRLGDLWLVGGASNTGGAVLKQFFTSAQLTVLTAQIDLSQPNPFDYYPLTAPGERFPINDLDYPPRLTPRPEQDADFLYGLLDSMARIESEGYQKLMELGASPLTHIYTAGGGAQNQVWQTLRQRRTGVPVAASIQTEAAYGTARLAKDGLSTYKNPI